MSETWAEILARRGGAAETAKPTPKGGYPRLEYLLEAAKRQGEYLGHKHGDPDFCYVVCPNQAAHSMDSGITETALHVGGSSSPFFKCLHSHCAELKLKDYAEHVGCLDLFQKQFLFTDLGNVCRLGRELEGQVAYCVEGKEWFVKVDGAWQRHGECVVLGHACNLAARLYEEAMALPEDRRKAYAAWALKSQMAGHLEAMCRLLKGQPHLHITRDQFNLDCLHLNTPEGAVELATGKMLPSSHLAHEMRETAVGYAPGAKAPHFEAFFRHLFPDPATAEYVHRLVGYSATGLTKEKLIVVCVGPTNSGKTTFLQAIGHALGSYARSAPPKILLFQREEQIPNDLAALQGRRFVFVSEIEEGKRMAVAAVKAMTGADRINARFLHKEWFEFRPQFTIWLATNYKPVVRETGDAIWERLKLLTFPEAPPEINRDLAARLEEEAAGILAWVVEGAAKYLESGLKEPAPVVQAGLEYRAEMNLVEQFIDEQCVRDPETEVMAASLHGAYVDWCRRHGEGIMSQRMFGQVLSQLEFTKRRVAKGILWKGVRPLSWAEMKDFPTEVHMGRG